jgi:hypothetical protein
LYFKTPSPGSVLINKANDCVPAGGFRQVSEGLEPEPSHVTSDDKAPSAPTSALDSTKVVGATGLVVEEALLLLFVVVLLAGSVLSDVGVLPPPPPHAEIKRLNINAMDPEFTLFMNFIEFPWKTLATHQIV